MWMESAWAQAANAPRPGIFEQVFPIVLIIGVFYFFIIRPQSRKAKAHQEFVSNLRRGDSVVTGSGILGRIEALTEKFVTLEVADGVQIKVLRSAIAQSAQEKAT